MDHANLQLERQLCAEFELATAGGVGDLAEAGAAQGHARHGPIAAAEEELRCIGHAESLQAHFEIEALGEADGLGYGCVEVEKAGPAKKVATDVTKRRAGGSSKARRG